jgi:hypothetical protein
MSDLYAKAKAPPPHQPPKGENILMLGNRLLLRHVVSSGGLGSALKESQAFIVALAAEFSGYILERDELATPAEFIRRVIIGLSKLKPIAPETLALWEARMLEPTAQIPFSERMAISPDQALL